MASIAKPPKGLAEIIQNVIKDHHTDVAADAEPEHPQSPPILKIPLSSDRHSDFPAPSVARVASSGYRIPPVGTPAERTGPPRSISFNYSLSSAPAASPSSHPREGGTLSPTADEDETPDRQFDFPPASSPFRGALEYDNPEQREREREIAERKHKRRDSYFHEGGWNPRKWLVESPKEEETQFNFGTTLTEAGHGDEEENRDESRLSPQPIRTPLRQSRSMPHIQGQENERISSSPRWGRLRSLIPHIAQNRPSAPPHPAVTPLSVNITDELITGGLATLMIRLWIERDEKGHRRVPVLFHRLKIRISDSLHPMHGNKAVFRIECEYANGAVRWVVYRQLREFLSLHGHYAISNAYNRNVETLPEFPFNSLPYFKFLKEKGNELGKADFARLQRQMLENYLVGLMRAVMFHPASNRLAGFLELGALTIALAQSGAQYKAGFLRIDAVSPKGGLGRKAAGRSEKRRQRWCAIRESYLVVLEEMGELTVWDVFLIDQDFRIERPMRYYRQGLNLFHQLDVEHEDDTTFNGHKPKPEAEAPRRRLNSTVGSLKSSISKVFHLGNNGQSREQTQSANGQRTASTSHGRPLSTSSRSSASPSSIALSSRPLTPMLDPSTHTNALQGGEDHNEHVDRQAESGDQKKREKDVSKHTFYIENSQVRLKLFARNERQMLQWIAALERVARESHYTGKNRFDSFAPIRLNVAAQWLVDGRDYFWNLSRAILLARETIHIHDWWISPELEMRRPNKEKYRLDRLLERKAKEGVKIYIILYQEVSNRTTPTDSNYAKQRLTALHPNIMIQRSPSHFQTGTFYWAHHEKLCVIDQAIAFMGGLDLCFGRWDTPQHVLTDDPEPGPEASDHIWPGKDYSNPRVLDFHTLNKPHEDMYDRSKVPRMPWHDVSMQVVGQPARDLARHFVQRWNYLLRIKNHTRVMPFLLPPPEFKPGELSKMGLTGTCELQICRSAGPWSLGTMDRIEYSIQNAYLKAIQMSEHFVYIENQFFITSTIVDEVKIENKIGDALVHRIIRAHREGTPWKCCIVIPLLPGFAFPVDHSDASAIRIILECQNRTFCRGPNSIFGRLRKEGIDPDEYISFFSLRNWAKLRGDVLTTEQVYIHGKVCIVDDRLAIIGSANINERSQRGDRDSEIAAVIRDTDMIDCTMAGKPFKVGRFAHTLRVRLMREHIGVDVDAMYEEDLMATEPVLATYEQQEWDPENEQEYGKQAGVTHIGKSHRRSAMGSLWHDTVDGVEQAIHGSGAAGSKDGATLLRKVGLKKKGPDTAVGEGSLREEREMVSHTGEKESGFSSAIVPTLEEKIIAEHRRGHERALGTTIEEELEHANGLADHPVDGSIIESGKDTTKDHEPAQTRLEDGELYGAPADAPSDPQHDDQPPHARPGKNDADEEEEKAPGARAILRKHISKPSPKPWTLPTPTPRVDPHGFEDPISDEFWKDVWVACAVHNTEIYRKVFHAIPDDLVTTWKQYKEFVLHHERLNRPAKDQDSSEPLARMPSEAGDVGAPGQAHAAETASGAADNVTARESEHADIDGSRTSTTPVPSTPPASGPQTAQKEKQRKPARGSEPFDAADKEEMENLLQELRGHLVLYPTRFLEGEDVANNFLFAADRLMPLPIYD